MTSARHRASRKSRLGLGAWARGWFASAGRARAARQAAAFGHRRAIFEPLEERRLLALNILVATGGLPSIPAAALTFSDNSNVIIDPSAFASAGSNLDLQANNQITFQNAVSV